MNEQYKMVLCREYGVNIGLNSTDMQITVC